MAPGLALCAKGSTGEWRLDGVSGVTCTRRDPLPFRAKAVGVPSASARMLATMEPTVIDVFGTVGTLSGALAGMVGFVVFVATRSPSRISMHVTLWTAASFPALVGIAIAVAVVKPSSDQKQTRPV